MILLCDPSFVFSKQIYKDMYELKGMILNKRDFAGRVVNADKTYSDLCHVSFKICKVLKKKLPDSIHSRMVLGVKNYHAEQYIKYCVRHGL